jgi:hypothetical protein
MSEPSKEPQNNLSELADEEILAGYDNAKLKKDRDGYADEIARRKLEY